MHQQAARDDPVDRGILEPDAERVDRQEVQAALGNSVMTKRWDFEGMRMSSAMY
jgi:hypothetical protein